MLKRIYIFVLYVLLGFAFSSNVALAQKLTAENETEYNQELSIENSMSNIDKIVSKKASLKAVSTSLLINGSFELPPLQAGSSNNILNSTDYPGWSNSAENLIEVHGYVATASAPFNIRPPDGKQWIELNVDRRGNVYQDVITVPKQRMRWSLWHMGRLGVDAGNIELGLPNGVMDIQGSFSTGKNTWKNYTGVYTVPDNQTNTRVKINSTSGTTTGNLIDHVEFYPTANLKVASIAGKKEILLGESTAYTITLSNLGGIEASDVKVSIQLPKELSYNANSLVSSDTTVFGELYDSLTNKLTFKVSDIAINEVPTVSIHVIGKEITSKASLMTSYSYQDIGFTDTTYFEEANVTDIAVLPNDFPVITGENLVVQVGKPFNPLDGVTAADKEDGNLTDKIVVVNNPVNTAVSDIYFVDYEVSDSQGNKSTFQRKISVVPKMLLQQTILNQNLDATLVGAEPLDILHVKNRVSNATASSLVQLETFSMYLPEGVENPEMMKLINDNGQIIENTITYDLETRILKVHLTNPQRLEGNAYLELSYDLKVNYVSVGVRITSDFQVQSFAFSDKDQIKINEKSNMTVISLKDGSLGFLNVPTELNFGVITIPTNRTIFEREDKNWMIQIRDNRAKKNPWKITAILKQPMTSDTGDIISKDMLIFKQNGNQTVLSNESQEIYTSSSLSEQVDVTWNHNEGVLLEVDFDTYAKTYTSIVQFSLQEVP